MKKCSYLFLINFLVFSTFSCGNNNPSNKNKANSKIAFLTDYHKVEDESIFKSCYELVQNFCSNNDIPLRLREPNGNTDANRKTALKLMVEEGNNVFIMVGNNFADAILNIAPYYPSAKFIGINISKDDLYASYFKDYDSNLNNPKWDNEFINLNNVYTINIEDEIMSYVYGYNFVLNGYTNLGFIGSYENNYIKKHGFNFIKGIEDASINLNKEINVKYAYGNVDTSSKKVTDRLNTWFGLGLEGLYAFGGDIYLSGLDSASQKGINGKVLIDNFVLKESTLDTYQSSIIGISKKVYLPYLEDVLNSLNNGTFNSGNIEVGIDDINYSSNCYFENKLFKEFNNDEILLKVKNDKTIIVRDYSSLITNSHLINLDYQEVI